MEISGSNRWRYCTLLYHILGHIFLGYSLKFRPYIGLIYGRYFHWTTIQVASFVLLGSLSTAFIARLGERFLYHIWEFNKEMADFIGFLGDFFAILWDFMVI